MKFNDRDMLLWEMAHVACDLNFALKLHTQRRYHRTELELRIAELRQEYTTLEQRLKQHDKG